MILIIILLAIIIATIYTHMALEAVGAILGVIVVAIIFLFKRKRGK